MIQQQLIDAFDENIPLFATQLVEKINAMPFGTYASFSHEQLIQAITAAVQAFANDLRAGGEQYSHEHWTRIASIRAKQNANIEDLMYVNVISEDVFNQFVLVRFAADGELCIWWLKRLHQIVYAQVQALARVFVAVREQFILEQNEQIRELSTPSIPIYAGVVVLPIVGTISSSRTGQIMEGLLNSITSYQADVVIIDITGVPVVDTEVANYLMQAARAARLLGATVVLVGIGTKIAQTIVQLGLDLSDIVIRADLQTGIAYALERQGLAIQPLR